MKDNRGLSLIELVVTIAIMAIVSTGVVISVYSSAGWKAKKAITEMDQVLSETRVQALSKTQAWMELEGRFTITYHTNDGAVTDVAVQDMILSFDRASGAFSGLYTDSTLQTCRYVGASAEVLQCDEIIVTQGSREWKIRLYPETGKHKVEK